MKRSVGGLMWKIVMFGLVGLLQALAPESVHAQTGQYFQFPSWGGSVLHPFNDLNAAAPGKYHTGCDIVMPGNKSTYILASAYGVVDGITKNDGNDHGMGNCIVIRHKVVVNSKGATATFYTLYAHLDSVNVKAGQAVAAGDIIGVMGRTGKGKPDWWDTIHLHFEVKTVGVTGTPAPLNAFWGYTPNPAQNYGYINPADVLGKWYAIK